MSSVKDSLLDGPSEYSDFGTVKKETTVAVEPKRHTQGCDGSTYSGPGSECVSFHNVTYEVTSCFSRKKKMILNSVSGLLPKGLNAIMGPTGSGKTSLLDILAGRKHRAGLGGHVLVNGQWQPSNFKCISGYVVQDDIIMGTLTVRENFHFSAALRLPSHMTFKQRKERVENIIDELGLTKCADTKIGNDFIRGVSGGERKRTSIGMELIIEPQVLFLDEPTTGLDANTAISVVQLLKRLSIRGNHIVIMSIHQPRYSIFKLLDTVTLLSVGNVVYHGPASNALDYFSGAGFQCEEHDNPADFLLDVVTFSEKSGNHGNNNGNGNGSDEPSQWTRGVDLSEYYHNSDQYGELQDQLTPIVESAFVGTIWKQQTPSYATNFFWQFLVVAFRSVVNLLRNPMTSVIQWMTALFFALLVGIIFFRLNEKEYNSQTVISDRLGALFFIIMNQVFGNLSAVDLFIKEKALFIHENVSGFYRVSVFFLAKVLIDLILMRILPLCLYCVIAYFMVGFTLNASNFFIFLLTLTLTSITATSQAFALAGVTKSAFLLDAFTSAANLLIALSFVLFMLFGGFLIALSSLPEWLRWMKYVSFFRYSLEALSINEINGHFYCANNTFTDSDLVYSNNNCTNGTFALDKLGYSTDHTWIWYDQVGLVGLSLVFLAITYLNLLTTKKLK